MTTIESTRRRARHPLWTAILAGAVLALPVGAADEPATAGFRAGHAEIQVHLEHLDGMVGSLEGATAEQQRRTMAFVVRFLTEHILEHARWEESRLYPLVDEKAGRQGEPFTASMRYEHGIIGRAIADLDALAQAEELDGRAFARAADGTLRIIAAHFEKEEEVFLPLLDRTMTRTELDRALGTPTDH